METTDYRVLIPEENYQLINFRQEGLPGVMVLNKALKDFEPKIVFSWNLSIMLTLEDLIDNGMPSAEERAVLDPYGDLLDAVFKGNHSDKPNALFLARITYNKTRELLYRVFDPKPVHDYLQKAIEERNHVRNFDYRMEDDPEWKLVSWHLNTLNVQPSATTPSPLSGT